MAPDRVVTFSALWVVLSTFGGGRYHAEIMVITIDGPAGSGKSTAARKLAARLEISYLDTGAMYRAIAFAALHRGVDPADAVAVVQLARSMRLELDCGPTHTRVRVDGHDVSESIRTLEVSAATSHVARNQALRVLMVEQQRAIGERLGSFVTEGRDQGSVVFPEADFRFVLEASLEKRTERRFQESIADGEDVTALQIQENLRSRDSVDAKQWEALLRPGQAIVLDTSALTIHEVVDRMVEHIEASVGQPPARN